MVAIRLHGAPRVLALATTLAVSITCVNPETPTGSNGDVVKNPVATIVVSITATTIDKDETAKATAELRDASQNILSDRVVTWSSNNPSAVRVDATTGDITGLAEGLVDIVATSEGVNGRGSMSVHRKVASVNTALGASALFVRGHTTAVATPLAKNGEPLSRPVSWSSSNTVVATVDGTGAVTANGAGTAMISATCEGTTGQAFLSVSAIPVASLSVTLNASTLTVGSTTAANAVARDVDNNVLTGRAVTWSSSNAAVASVSASGIVTALSAGSANIIGVSEGVTGQASVTVTLAPVASVTVNLVSGSLSVGQTTSASAVMRDASNNVLTGRAVTWSSDNTAVATVNASGTVTAVSVGSANIRATSEGVTGQAGITVSLVPVASVTVTLASGSLVIGQTTSATAVTRDAANNVLTGRAITWSSTNTAVATVNASGVVTAVAGGSANIRATSEGVSGQAVVAVALVSVSSVTVTLASGSLNVGQTTSASAVTRDAANNVLTGRVVTWSSSNTAVATVNASGTVTAVGAGSANIIATSEGVTGQAGITVTLAPVASVAVTLAAGTVAIGQTTTASAVMRDASNNVLTGRAVTWSSDNTAVATVNSSGVVTAVSVGSANIQATSEGVTGQAAVTVSPVPVASVTVTLADGSLFAGQNTTASAVTRDAANNILTGRSITWSSSNTAVATVNASGVVTAVSVGSANIRATSEGVTGQAAITVSAVPVASVTVNLGSASINVGQTTTASAVTRDASNNVLTGRVVTWTSSNTAVATVTASGTVRGITAGTANIVATSEGVSGQTGITVVFVPVASVTVSLGSASLAVGLTTTASAVTRDASNNILTGRVVTWSSSNTAIATVNASGTVTAIAVGAADITALSEGVTGSATFTVTAAPPTPTLAWASDWHTATGTSNAAKNDGGKWDLSVDGGGPTNRLEVVSATGLDFPSGMANVLKVLNRFTNWQNDYWNVLVQNGWQLPAIGGSITFRLYFRYNIGAGTGGDHLHAVQTGPPGNCPYTAELLFGRATATTFDFSLATYGGTSSGGGNAHEWQLNFPLNREVTYRIEEQYIRQGTNTWKAHARLYDSSNNLIASDANFADTYGSGTNLATYSGNITSGTDCFRNKMIGFPNQNGGSDDAAHQHIYYGGFAVSLNGWIGPYVAGESP